MTRFQSLYLAKALLCGMSRDEAISAFERELTEPYPTPLEKAWDEFIDATGLPRILEFLTKVLTPRAPLPRLD